MISSSRLGAYLGVLSEHKEPSPVFMTIQIPIERLRCKRTSPQQILLSKPVHLRLIEPCAEVDHAGGGVVVLAVVAEPEGRFANLLAEGGIALGSDVLLCQSAAEGVPGVIVADLRSDRTAPVVDILRPGITCLCRDTL